MRAPQTQPCPQETLPPAPHALTWTHEKPGVPLGWLRAGLCRMGRARFPAAANFKSSAKTKQSQSRPEPALPDVAEPWGAGALFLRRLDLDLASTGEPRGSSQNLPNWPARSTSGGSRGRGTRACQGQGWHRLNLGPDCVRWTFSQTPGDTDFLCQLDGSSDDHALWKTGGHGRSSL